MDPSEKDYSPPKTEKSVPKKTISNTDKMKVEKKKTSEPFILDEETGPKIFNDEPLILEEESLVLDTEQVKIQGIKMRQQLKMKLKFLLQQEKWLQKKN